MKIESGRMLNDYIQPNKKQYCIPVFQRDYAWTSDQCKKLFEDIVLAYQKDRQHFCGSFVYAPFETKNHIDSFIIIDGQQRFTTLYILIKALADSAEDPADKATLENILINEDRFNRYNLDEKSKLKLKPVKSDNAQLLLLMNGKLDEMDKSATGIIYHNYTLFRDLISDFLAKNPENSVMMIYDGIDRLICADIRLSPEDDAQEIFERINSTGIKLGIPDLIRNYVLMTDADQTRLYEEYWLKTQEMLSKDELESFFWDYLNMKLDGFTKESTAYSDFKQIYEAGNYTNESMLQEILHYAKQYHIFRAGDPNLSAEVNNTLLGFRQLSQTTVYLFLFSVFDDFEDGIIDESELAKTLKLLLNYNIRRSVCEIGSNSLRGFYKTLYGRVFHVTENKNHYYDAIATFLLQLTSKDAIPSDTDFARALKEHNLYRKNALCKYLLIAIENQGKEKVQVDNLSIEHIMPQNKNLSTSWQRMLGDNWATVKDRYLHTLGNLTLTGYNSELGDLPFDEKQEKLAESITHITVLYSDVRDKTQWNAKTIEARAQRLADLILGLFPIDPPQTKIEFADPRYKEYTVADPNDATYKSVAYYELLGERIIVENFAAMVRSVARKLYDIDSSIIEQMATTLACFPTWSSPVFSYEEKALRNPVRLQSNSNIYISTGYSAYDCICFIRALLRKYGLNLEEDFIYCARPTNANYNELNRISIAKKWCEVKQSEGRIIYDLSHSHGRYVRFTTPVLNQYIPDSPEKLSPWKTRNFYFYEITNHKGEFFIQLYFYCKNLTSEMKQSFLHLSDILDKGPLAKGYKLYFMSTSFPNGDEDTEETVLQQLNSMLQEIKSFEAEIASKW